jgi:ABC-2 type transport system permease protein
MTNQFFGNTSVLLGRSLRHITRSVDTIITTTIMARCVGILVLAYAFALTTYRRKIS